MTCSGDWWNGFFTGLFVEFWQAAIPAESTRSDIEFLQKHLRLEPGCRVLDVPCGHGRHSLELAQRGCRMTGLDFSEDALSAARRSAAENDLRVDWIQGDMRELPWRADFDAAFCAGNSFGYFDDDGNQSFLDGVGRAVRPGGRFLLESGWIAEALLADFHERLDLKVPGGIRFHAENRYDPARGAVESRFTVSRRGKTLTRPGRHRVYTYRELVGMLEAAGFGDFEAFGSVSGEPFALGSRRLLLTAVRSA
ncbi:MAG: SAM-dependent methyltransferase [Acidobacteriota bacterium]